MGWIDDEGSHEGFAVVRFADGRLGSGRTADGGARVLADASGARLPEDTSRPGLPWSEVVGWHMACDCATHRATGSLWLSDPPLVRVPTPRLDDAATGRVYATDEDAAEIDEAREDVQALLLAAWRRHRLPDERAGAIRDAADQARTAVDALDHAVAAARHDGLSWAQIGAAAGMTRQSAHERWNALTARPAGGPDPLAPDPVPLHPWPTPRVGPVGG